MACALPAAATRTVQDGLLLDGVPARDARVESVWQRYQVRRDPRVLAWLSDGSLLLALRTQGQDQLLRLRDSADAGPAFSSGSGSALRSGYIGTPADPVQTLSAQWYRPDAVVYLQHDALYLIPLSEAGAVARLLVTAAARPGAPVWAQDNDHIAFTAALRDPQAIDLYVQSTSQETQRTAPRLVAVGLPGKAWQVLAWTNADHALLVVQTLSATEDALLLVDAGTGASHRIDAPTEHPAGVGHITAARLAPDQRGVYFLSDRGGVPAQLHYVDLYGGTARLADAQMNHSLEVFDVSANGQELACAWNEAGYSRVATWNLKTHQMTPIVGLTPGVVSAMKYDHGGARLAIDWSPSTAPRRVYVIDSSPQATLSPAAAVRTMSVWAQGVLGLQSASQGATVPATPPADPPVAPPVAPQAVHYPTWDRLNGGEHRLAALLYRPRTAGPHPVLVLLHDALWPVRTQFDPFIQFCANELGFVVIATELRSGEAGALDAGALLTWIGVQPNFRRDRVAVAGRGSAGTLALTALGLYTGRLRAAVSIDGGATNAHVGAIRQPVLLVRGLRSPPLDARSAEQLLWRLRSNKVASELIAPPTISGSIADEPQQSSALQAIAQFLSKYLAD